MQFTCRNCLTLTYSKSNKYLTSFHRILFHPKLVHSLSAIAFIGDRANVLSMADAIQLGVVLIKWFRLHSSGSNAIANANSNSFKGFSGSNASAKSSAKSSGFGNGSANANAQASSKASSGSGNSFASSSASANVDTRSLLVFRD